MQTSIKPGVYRHVDGRLYRVLGLKQQRQTGLWLVIYQSLFGDEEIWVRPLEHWQAPVQSGGISQPRFVYVSGQ